MKGLGVSPHILLGDFDSISEEDFRRIKSSGAEVCQFPVEKDMTDSELAVDIAVERGATEVVFIGCMGARMDHTLANIFLLKKLLDRGINAVLIDEYNEIRLIKDYISLDREEGMKISLLPFTARAVGVSTQGLYYPLSEATLEVGGARGVSNEFSSGSADRKSTRLNSSH